MPSTFFGLTVASSALNAFQASVNTTANNIANVNTKGFSRQEAIREAADAIRTNMRYGTVGTGVNVVAVKQIRDEYYDVKYWASNADRSLQENRMYYSQQIEDYVLDDDAVKGFSTILNEMFDALDTLKTHSGDSDKRQQFISKCQSMVNYFSGMYAGFEKIQDGCNREIYTQVNAINAIGKKIASLNKQINIIELQGGYANELRDQRALLIDELSGMVSVECKETPVTNSNYPDMYLGGTNFTVKINGQTFVSNFEYNELECVARDYKVNQCDTEGLYDVRWKMTKNPLATTSHIAGGSLKGLFEMRDGNNKENFRATVSGSYNEFGVTKLTLTGASIKDVKTMTMNNEGVIRVNNKEYRYTDFAYDAEKDTYTFTLDERLDSFEREKVYGKSVEIGTSVDAMGIPYFMGQINTFIRAFCEEFNNLQKSGVDGKGNAAGAFFVSKDLTDGTEYDFSDYNANGSMDTTKDTYYSLTAATLNVAYALTKDPMLMATISKEDYENPDDVDHYSLVESMLKLKSEVTLFRGGGADDFLKCLVSDNTMETQKSKTMYETCNNITNTIDTRRMSVSGVDEDEEALNMMKFQYSYNLASRMIQTMSEMYNRLILETGV